MASPNSKFTELVSTTFRKHKAEFADNTTKNNALLARINRKGNKRTEDGGLTIVCELDYQENGTYQRYSGYDVLDISASDVLSAAEYNWRQSAVHVTASGRELRVNSGASRIINLAKSRLTNAMRTFKNNISSDIYSDGTAANQINGLTAICPDATGGTLGGINGSTFTFWAAKIQDASSPISGSSITLSSTSFEDPFMLQLYLEQTRGSDRPDLITLSNDYYTFFEGTQISIKRYSTDTSFSEDKATGGFVGLKYKTADVFHDGGSGITAAHGYMLNTDYLGLCVHRDADMDEVPEMRAINQDAVVIPIIWMGNLTCSNRSLQGVMHA
ncbi:MAG: phage major capsid protein [Euryarchaeota archaeon]|nr:phage major capsid protein [Euryarchaeota archaeon]